MAKSLKRAVACLLAVLIVAFSMPLSALAAPGDYNPDIELLFQAVNLTADPGMWTSYDEHTSATKNEDLILTEGASNVPLVYKDGTLTLKQSMAADYLDLNDVPLADTTLADGDITLGVGDYFLVTVLCKNISTLYALSGAIKFSDNIVPAGVNHWTVGSASKLRHHYTLSTNEEDCEWFGYYDDFSGSSAYGLDTEMNKIDNRGNIFFAVAGAQPYTDVSSYDEDGACMDPATGEAGYTYPNTAIIGTYMFYINAAGPITFEAADPNNTIYAQYAGGFYNANKADGTDPSEYTTVADNGGPGAQKMTYFADASSQPEDTYYTVTYVDADGATISTEEVIENGSPASIPALPAASGHDSYSWDVDPNGAVITAATTFTQMKTTSAHDYVKSADPTTPATCTTDAIYTYTCSICGDSYTEAEAGTATGHHYGEPVWNWDDLTTPYATFTCTEGDDTQSKNATVTDVYTAHTQEVKGYTTYTATVEFEGTTYTDTKKVDDADFAHDYQVTETVPATCTEDGSVTYTCSICGDSYNEVGDAATGHDWGEATFAWTGYTAATATRVCANDETHVETVDAVITSDTTPATPTVDGQTVYTATATFENGDVATDTQTETIPATGYTYAFDHFDWAADYSTATAVLVANEDSSVTTTAAATVTSAHTNHTQDAVGYTTYTASYEYEGETYTEDQVAYDAAIEHTYGDYIYNDDATCTEDGTKTATCSVCGAEDTVTAEDTATGHAYGAPVWAWDGTAATATFTCANDATHVEVVNATVADAYTDHTQEAKGYTTYTATVEFEGATYTDTKTVEDADFAHDYQVTETVPATCTEDGSVTYTCSICDASYTEVGDAATGHAWGEATFAWNGYESATATRVCANDETHVETVDAVITSETTPATATVDGQTVYTATATFENGDVATDTQTETIPATGYTYRFDHFDWAADYSAATAVLVANEDASVTTTAAATVTSAYTDHTQDAKGYTTYTATYVYGGETFTDSQTAEDADFAHDYQVTETVPATCTEDGSVTYTCSICGATYTEEGDKATGHAWGEATFAWDGYESATATRVCANDETHVETVDAVITSETTPATPTVDGQTVYTATATFEDGTVATDEQTETIPATGYTYTFDHFEWAADYSTAKAIYVADQDATVTKEYDAAVTSAYTAHTKEAKGYTTYTATYESETEEKVVEDAEIVHEWGDWTESEAAVAPSRTEAGKTAVETRTCSVCDETETRGGEEIPALAGILVKAVNYTNGTVKYTKGTEYDGGMLYAYGTEYTLTATPDAGYKFAGWEVKNKLISETKNTYSNVAFADMELTPVFVPDGGDTITVIFRDKSGNVISTVTKAAGEIADSDIPEAPAYPGMKFVNWTINDADVTTEDILALTASEQVWAKYEKDEAAAGYKVAVDGEAELKLPAGVSADAVPYNTKATVTAEGASAWMVDGVVVAYGDTYEFYVGNDITLTPVFDAVEEAPTVTIIGHNHIDGTKKQVILATESTPEGYTLKDRGFVYGRAANFGAVATKADAEAANLIDNLPTGTRRSSGIGNSSEQFSITVTAAPGVEVRAFAYIVVQNNATKETSVIYSDVIDFAAE